MKKLFVLCLLSSVFCPLSFCYGEWFTTEWSKFRGNPQNTGYTQELITPPLAPAWQFNTGGAIISSPAIANGIIYIGTRDSALYAVSSSSGNLIWMCKTQGWIDGTPVIGNQKVYFTSRDGYLYALRATDGKIQWMYRTNGINCSSPLIVGKRLFFGAGFPCTDIYCLYSDNGMKLWNKSFKQPVYSSPCYMDNVIFIGANDGKFYALNPDGSIKWSVSTAGGVYFSSPVVGDSFVYCVPGDYDKKAYALNKETGTIKWVNSLGSKDIGHYISSATLLRVSEDMANKIVTSSPYSYVSSPALDRATLYVCSGYPTLSIYALDIYNGNLKWQKEIGKASDIGFCSSPIITDTIVWVGSGSGILYAFSALTGDSLWAFSLGSPIISSPAFANGSIYVATQGGKITCFSSGGSKNSTTEVEEIDLLPKVFKLYKSYPSPFTHSTLIQYQIPMDRERKITIPCQLKIYNSAGQLVRTLVDKKQESGYYHITWDGKDNI
ncbi:MAG: PQQ-binding-like beta-propeller repeat protein [Candidatus Stahlbacteria bacterium]|nr:PQQ-binding-like beta-propeller repeat protein [Candidatus Stahlbacteria bacterium]